MTHSLPSVRAQLALDWMCGIIDSKIYCLIVYCFFLFWLTLRNCDGLNYSYQPFSKAKHVLHQSVFEDRIVDNNASVFRGQAANSYLIIVCQMKFWRMHGQMTSILLWNLGWPVQLVNPDWLIWLHSCWMYLLILHDCHGKNWSWETRKTTTEIWHSVLLHRRGSAFFVFFLMLRKHIWLFSLVHLARWNKQGTAGLINHFNDLLLNYYK